MKRQSQAERVLNLEEEWWSWGSIPLSPGAHGYINDRGQACQFSSRYWCYLFYPDWAYGTSNHQENFHLGGHGKVNSLSMDFKKDSRSWVKHCNPFILNHSRISLPPIRTGLSSETASHNLVQRGRGTPYYGPSNPRFFSYQDPTHLAFVGGIALTGRTASRSFTHQWALCIPKETSAAFPHLMGESTAQGLASHQTPVQYWFG